MKIHDMNKKEYEEIGKNAIEGVKDFDFSVLTKKLEHVIESIMIDENRNN